MQKKALTLVIFIFFSVILFANAKTCPLANGINVHTTMRVLNICKHGAVIKAFSRFNLEKADFNNIGFLINQGYDKH